MLNQSLMEDFMNNNNNYKKAGHESNKGQKQGSHEQNKSKHGQGHQEGQMPRSEKVGKPGSESRSESRGSENVNHSYQEEE